MVWTPKKIHALFKLSEHMGKHPESKHAKNKVLINAFFEPSTRTSLSFECAMKKMGGQVICFSPQTSSQKKGESDMDTLRTLANYGNVIVLRHPEPELYNAANEELSCKELSLINAGNGSSGHPTQALLDLYTMYKKYGMDFRFKRILFVGDIKHSRTVHSLIDMLAYYPQMSVHLYAYPGCEPSDDYVAQVAHAHYQDVEDTIIEEVFYEYYDVVYLTRYQKERHVSGLESPTNSVAPCTCFTAEDAKCLGNESIILHPFPRNDELHPDVDAYPQAYYFEQMKYGVELRMALLELIFDEQEKVLKKKDRKHYIHKFERSSSPYINLQLFSTIGLGMLLYYLLFVVALSLERK
jgi:aspartate carbamoyltransferase